MGLIDGKRGMKMLSPTPEYVDLYDFCWLFGWEEKRPTQPTIGKQQTAAAPASP